MCWPTAMERARRGCWAMPNCSKSAAAIPFCSSTSGRQGKVKGPKPPWGFMNGRTFSEPSATYGPGPMSTPTASEPWGRRWGRSAAAARPGGPPVTGRGGGLVLRQRGVSGRSVRPLVSASFAPFLSVSPLGHRALRRDQTARRSAALHRRRYLPTPLFIIHGEEDTGVAVADAHLLYEAAGEPKELWIIPGVGHGGGLSEVSEEYQRSVLAFFERHLAE